MENFTWGGQREEYIDNARIELDWKHSLWQNDSSADSKYLYDIKCKNFVGISENYQDMLSLCCIIIVIIVSLLTW